MLLHITSLCVFACVVMWVGWSRIRQSEGPCPARLHCEGEKGGGVMLQMYRHFKVILNIRRTLAFVVFWLWCKTRYFPSSVSIEWGESFFFSFLCSLFTHACQNGSQNLTVNTFIWKVVPPALNAPFFWYDNFSWSFCISIQFFVQSIQIVIKACVVARKQSNVQSNIVSKDTTTFCSMSDSHCILATLPCCVWMKCCNLKTCLSENDSQIHLMVCSATFV